jgi:hypothetical protein
MLICSRRWWRPRTFAQGDFDYSGTVDVNNLGILATRWQQALVPPSALFMASRASSRARPVIDQIAL